jgi:hypothetical protein
MLAGTDHHKVGAHSSAFLMIAHPGESMVVTCSDRPGREKFAA